MAKRSFSIKNKILIVIATLPVFSIGLVVLMATSTFKDDKVTYVFDTVLSGAQAKSSSADSQINSFLQSLKALTVNYDPIRSRLTTNGNKFFQSERSVKGFFDYEWTGKDFNLRFEKNKDAALEGKDKENLIQLLQEAWYNEIAIGVCEELPMHLLVAVRFGQKSHIAALLIESENFFSLFNQTKQGESFLYHKEKGFYVGSREMAELSQYLRSNVFNKEINETTFETEINQQALLTSLSKVSVGGLYIVSVVDKKSALVAVEKLTYRAILFTAALLSFLLFIGVFAANRLTAPLRNLTDATSKVMEGDFTVKVKSKSHDEIGSLALSFNKMTEEVSRLMLKTAENARMETELKTAQTVQETLFPKPEAKIGPLRIFGKSQPASECGGDWWHYSRIGSLVYVWIGDATGHGAPAALLTSAVRAVASVVENTPDISPAHAMAILNRAIYVTSKGQMMMTFFLGCFDPENGKFTYSNASHDPPFYLTQEIKGKPKRKDYFPLMEVNNPRLGEKDTSKFVDYEMKIEKGDKFVFYTDGILDVKNVDGENWGERRFLKSLAPINELDQKETVTSVFDQMNEFRQETPLDDDVTLIIVEYDKKSAA